MAFYNKTILVPSLSIINLLLCNKNIVIPSYLCIYEDRFAIKHYTRNDMNVLRVWKTKSWFDYWYNDFSDTGERFIAALDYTINDDHIKIEHICVNDGENNGIYQDALDNHDASELIISLFAFVTSVAKEEKKMRITMDVHENLRLYNKYYKDGGFVLTCDKCQDNPVWIKTQINL